MIRFGIYLIIFGIGSIILNSMGYEFRILSWMGESVLLRAAIAALGAVLVIIGFIQKRNEPVDNPASEG